MVDLSDDRVDRIFHALADPTRRSLLERLGRGDFTVGELAKPFAISLAAVSKHLKVLERAGLIERRHRRQQRRTTRVASV